MSVGIQCARCLGRLSESDYDFKRKMSARLGKPFTPPRVCFECLMGMLLTLGDDDPDAAKDAKGE